MTERTRPPLVPALYAGIALAVGLAAFYVHIITPYVRFPADLLMWGETDFTGNIIRLRGGNPMYSPLGDLNSSTYPPLASILTYVIARTLGMSIEVPSLRLIQMGYVAGAVAIGFLCWRLLRRIIPNRREEHGVAWSVFTVVTLFLAATSPNTGRWVHTLHTDALLLFWSLVSFGALVLYLSRPSTGRLVLLAAAPAIGFAIKQYALIWAPIAFMTLLIDDPRRLGRLVQLVVVTTILTGLGLLVAVLFWGQEYFFWVFQVIGGARSRITFRAGDFDLSIPRAIDHLLRAWGPLSLGFLGGWILLSRFQSRRAAALWTPWLLLVAAEAMTSGTGWGVLYHFGPAVLIGAVWLCVVLPEVWPETSHVRPMSSIVRSGWALCGVVALFAALGTVPTGVRSSQRYWNQSPPSASNIEAIEAEFDGYEPADVLIDWGNWVYLRTNHLARDRAIAMADLPNIGRYDLLEPLLARIRSRRYKKILLHDYHDPVFVYDWATLDRPTGVRAALQENYDEIRIIKGLPEQRPGPTVQYGGDVSVLVPKATVEGPKR